ncbi:MAG: hypothetical protein P8X64_08820 [Anaerolineales bacterium]|jgi:hypothetical protein
MRFEALAWSLLEVIAPALTRLARQRWTWFTQEWLEVSAWLHDLLIPYLALILGSISGRDAGLVHLPLYNWGPAGTACLAGLAAAFLVLRSLPHTPHPHATPLEVLRPEPRLALYRAAMAAWVSDLPLAIAIGGLLAASEWLLAAQPWSGKTVSSRSWAQFMRIGFSGVIFWATRNLWLTAATQSVAVLLIQRTSQVREARLAVKPPEQGKKPGSSTRPEMGDEPK